MKDFNKKAYKLISFDKKSVFVGMKIKFLYGAGDRQYWSPMDGCIKNIFEKGVECWTDTGTHCPSWDRIVKMYVPKKKVEIIVKRTQLGDELSGIVDGAMDKIFELISFKYNQIKIKDDKVNLSTRYKREMEMGRGSKKVKVIGENGRISISSENERKKTLKLNRDNIKLKNIIEEIEKRLTNKEEKQNEKKDVQVIQENWNQQSLGLDEN